MSPTRNALSLLRTHDFQIMLREQIRCEMDIYHSRRMRKYKFAGFLVLVFLGFTAAVTVAGLLLEACERWLFGR